MAGIIKAGQSTLAPGGAQPAAFQLGDISAQASAALAAARKQAQDILAQAQREAKSLQAAAEKRGYEAALAAAEQKKKQELENELRAVLPALRSAAEQLSSARQAWIQNWETQVVRLASQIAAKLIRRQLDADPHIPLALIREALELATGQQRVRLELNPGDVQRIGEQARALADQWNRLCATEIVPTDDVPPGSCRLRTEHGVIDQTFDAQLARIEEELLNHALAPSTS